MQFVNLRERPDAIDLVAPWHHAEWHGFYPAKTLADFAADLAESLQSTSIPQTWLLLDHDGAMVGTCSLLTHDMSINRHLSPWLANIYVHPDARGRGLGKVIVQHVMAQAGGLGIPTLYLFTEDQQGFYEKLGWQLLERQSYEGETVSLMQWQSRPLDTHNACVLSAQHDVLLSTEHCL